MSRIKEKFTELEVRNEKALIAYIMAGFPNEKSTLATVRGLVKGGVDIIELGFPFSDPLADGPVIQNASLISLENGTKINSFFNTVTKIRKETDIPLILMTYTNILYSRGYQKFISDAKKAGKNVKGKDFDHKDRKFKSVKKNRGNDGKGTKREGKKKYRTSKS